MLPPCSSSHPIRGSDIAFRRPALPSLPAPVQSATRSATELVGQLAHTEEIKDAIRDSGGILALMRQLKQDAPTEGVLEVVTRAITMLTINNKTNQDYIRYAAPRI